MNWYPFLLKQSRKQNPATQFKGRPDEKAQEEFISNTECITEGVLLGTIHSNVLQKFWALNPKKRALLELWQWYLCLEFQGMEMVWAKVSHNLSTAQKLDFQSIQTGILKLSLSRPQVHRAPSGVRGEGRRSVHGVLCALAPLEINKSTRISPGGV